MSTNPTLDVVQAAQQMLGALKDTPRLGPEAAFPPDLIRARQELSQAVGEFFRVEKVYHQVKISYDGWFVMHPLSCRPNLFECGATYHPDRELVPGLWRLELVGDEWELVERLDSPKGPGS